jgi:hypothetical protein
VQSKMRMIESRAKQAAQGRGPCWLQEIFARSTEQTQIGAIESRAS